ncbi:Lipid A export ATP-binding/permease protein MsbA [Labilithrix luteola]|uniref:Lipid A export ATP-binding/permease protein MsbA n=1 Tax=Labilithrix luteola TaxID=1391654 RepID=A0A0K1QDI8_9BACT|nr:ATP-binding cassette domain-containing protein [Labilithrix luteola]AKV03783.1 Lipid A export ATP-binding/permease protein MsbA [Labilithrix luteola]
MQRSFLAPETLQISMMDCGVASLTTLLAGYGVHVNYERLRAACQTTVDGTSIDALEDVANDLGVEVVQHLVPLQYLPEALEGRLPAILITSVEGQPPHFVVLWRRIGRWLQVMDPACGRVWTTPEKLAADYYIGNIQLEEEAFLDWFPTSVYKDILLRLERSLLSGAVAAQVRGELEAPQTPRELAALDSALRMTARLGDVEKQSARWRNEAFERIRRAALTNPEQIPQVFRGFLPNDDGTVHVRAAVALAPERANHAVKKRAATELPAAKLLVRKEETGRQIWKRLLALLATDARVLALTTGVGLFVTALAGAAELLLYRAAWDAPRALSTFGQRLAGVFVIASLLVLVMLLEGALLWASRSLGRYLEVRLRLLTSTLLPRADDEFIRSRPTSDLAYRAHALTLGRALPATMVRLVQEAANLSISVAALALIDLPNLAVAAAGIVAMMIALFYVRSRLQAVDRRFQTHGARLLSIFLDALRGFRPLRLHGYQNAFRADQARELTLWQQTGAVQTTTTAGLASFEEALGTLVLLALFLVYTVRSNDPRVFVVLAFWAFRIPASLKVLFSLVEAWPAQRNAFTQLLELASYVSESEEEAPSSIADATIPNRGVGIQVDGLSVVANGQTILDTVNLEIPPAQHVAIVGPSGAGKSSLASVLLGLYSPSEGRVLIDGAVLDKQRLALLREETAWVDPAGQLWNQSLFSNLEYASRGRRQRGLLPTLEMSDLISVLDGMEQGLNTQVGSEGRLVSGGEGQRLRLGRALLREGARFVVLDEPFRGLDRVSRRRLALRSRLAWQRATMLFISHDIGHALDFDRVLVVEGGRIVEDGHPLELRSRPSRFAALLAAETEVLNDTWATNRWRRLRVEDGEVREVNP